MDIRPSIPILRASLYFLALRFCTLEPIMMLAVLGVNPQHTSAVSLRSLSLSEGYSLLSRAILSLSDRMSLSYFFSISRMWDS